MQTLNFLENALWWGGEVGSYDKMPISEADTFEIDFFKNGHNQTAPVLLSSK